MFFQTTRSIVVFVAFISAQTQVMGYTSGLPVDHVARQTSQNSDGLIPPQCAQTCEPLTSSLNNCPTNECLCTNANGASLSTCVVCIVNLQPTPELTALGNVLLDQFNDGCAEFNIDTISLPAPTTGTGAASPSGTSDPPAPGPASGPTIPANPVAPTDKPTNTTTSETGADPSATGQSNAAVAIGFEVAGKVAVLCVTAVFGLLV